MPIIDRQILPWLRLAHGIFNAIIILLFFYQARLGFVIRKARRANASLPFEAAKRHRTQGPVLAGLGFAGFFAGISIVTLGERNYLEHWHHLFAGFAIMLLLLAAFVLSQKIKGPETTYRNPHMAIGIVILVLYLFNAFLGVGILL